MRFETTKDRDAPIRPNLFIKIKHIITCDRVGIIKILYNKSVRLNAEKKLLKTIADWNITKLGIIKINCLTIGAYSGPYRI